MDVYNVFYTSLLRPDSNDPLPGQYNELQPPVLIRDADEDGEPYEEWEVEEILDSKMKLYGRLAYRVALKGHPPNRQWYNATRFKNSLELVKAFYDKYLDKPQSLRIKQHVLD